MIYFNILIICSRQYVSHAICSVLCTPARNAKDPFSKHFLIHLNQISQVRVPEYRAAGSSSEFPPAKVAVGRNRTHRSQFQVTGSVVLSFQTTSSV